VSESWTNEPGFSVKAAGRFEVEDFAIQIPGQKPLAHRRVSP
jgi:hypothetical protein